MDNSEYNENNSNEVVSSLYTLSAKQRENLLFFVEYYWLIEELLIAYNSLQDHGERFYFWFGRKYLIRGFIHDLCPIWDYYAPPPALDEIQLCCRYIDSHFKYLIPSGKREEIIGDLVETEFEMLENAVPNWKIRCIMGWHIFMIGLAMTRVVVSDFGMRRQKN